MYRNLAISLPC